jgi:pimeloyl-ACP methyl ester carboxylesterase
MMVLACLFPGCRGSASGPLEIIWYESKPVSKQNLIVFLRGMGGAGNCMLDPHKCFEETGFVTAVRKRNLPFDMVAPNLHFGYYLDRTFVDRLKRDVIEPARARGYGKIWLVGASMGGLGSIFYLKEHPEDIDGVILLGPFLGDDDILDQIHAAGGLKNWNPETYSGEEKWQRDIWAFLKESEHGNPERPPIYLGFGKKDYLVKGHKLLAGYILPKYVVETAGGHNYASFIIIWEAFLDRKILEAGMDAD